MASEKEIKKEVRNMMGDFDENPLCKFGKKVGKFIKKLFLPAPPRKPVWRPEKPQRSAFMYFVIKQTSGKPITKSYKIAKKIEDRIGGLRWRQDGEGNIVVSGECNMPEVMEKIEKSGKFKADCVQFGQCSSYLYKPEPKKDPPPHYKNHNSNLDLPPFNPFFQPQQMTDYGYNYNYGGYGAAPQPQLGYYGAAHPQPQLGYYGTAHPTRHYSY